MADSLTDPAFLRRLETLHLLARKVLGGTLQADRRSTTKGRGLTFADYTPYAFGDDIRAIDWRVYARLEHLLIKMFEVDEDATIYLLVDLSPSMAPKLGYAKQLAAALGYLALNNMDKLVVYGMADRLELLVEPCHGRSRVLPFLRALEAAETFGAATDFNAVAKELAVRHRRKGLVVCVSDFLFPGGYDAGFKRLLWKKHDLFCMQVLAPEELRCDDRGDLELVCVESGETQRVTVTPAEAKAYEAAVQAWNADLDRACRRRGVGLARSTTDYPFHEVIQTILRRGGLVA